MALHCNNISHWLGTSLESTLWQGNHSLRGGWTQDRSIAYNGYSSLWSMGGNEPVNDKIKWNKNVLLNSQSLSNHVCLIAVLFESCGILATFQSAWCLLRAWQLLVTAWSPGVPWCYGGVWQKLHSQCTAAQNYSQPPIQSLADVLIITWYIFSKILTMGIDSSHLTHYGELRSMFCEFTVLLNSLGPSDSIWRQRSGLKLAQVMACCLMAPSSAINHWNYREN